MPGSAARPGVTITELDADNADEVAEFYRCVLVPHFRPDELESSETIAAGLKEGGTGALVARTAQGGVVGGAVLDLFPHSRVLLLSYLAVAASERGSGTGRLLMTAIPEVYGPRLSPSFYVMEVDHPGHHHSDPDIGDPAARVRFYERLGARTLPLPYFQPALGPKGRRVRHMLLMVFGQPPADLATRRVDGSLVEAFLTEYLELAEGPVPPDDAEAQRLLAACRRPDGLPLLRLSELPSWDATC